MAASAVVGVGNPHANAFTVGIHEDITRQALSFLRSGVFDDIVDEHGEFADDEGAWTPWLHADGCSFGETVHQINVLQHEAVQELAPGAGFEPWSASDHFGLPLHPAQDFYSHSNWVELGFPIGDDPATEDIVEGLDTTDLVNFGTTMASGLGSWGAPRPLGFVRGNIRLGDLIVTSLVSADSIGQLEVEDRNGNHSIDVGDAVEIVEIPSSWQIGLLPHPTQPGAAWFVPGIDVHGAAAFTYLTTPSGRHKVPIISSGVDHRFLISGVGGRPIANVFGNQCDPFVRDANGKVITPRQLNTCNPPGLLPDDYSCIAYYGSDFALTHSGSARSELNKGNKRAAPSRFPRAKALAILQTKYEWCRFLNLAGREGRGADGIALALWVRENASPHPVGTPCGPDNGGGPRRVTVSVDEVSVLNDGDNDDDEPGEINLSIVLYDSPFEFHRSAKSKSGPSFADDDHSTRPSSLHPCEEEMSPQR